MPSFRRGGLQTVSGENEAFIVSDGHLAIICSLSDWSAAACCAYPRGTLPVYAQLFYKGCCKVEKSPDRRYQVDPYFSINLDMFCPLCATSFYFTITLFRLSLIFPKETRPCPLSLGVPYLKYPLLHKI